MSDAADTASVLFANEAFYVAFESADADAMDRVWARREGVSCLHPGWPPLIGRDAVMQSWRGILANPAQPRVRAHGAEAELHGDAAVVICFETVGGFTLVASNIFVREAGAWRLVHHQSGETQAPPDGVPEDEGRGRLQ